MLKHIHFIQCKLRGDPDSPGSNFVKSGTAGKTKLKASLLLLVIIAVYLFTGSLTHKTVPLEKEGTAVQNPPPTPGWDSRFLIGAAHTLLDEHAPAYERYDLLGFNLWHCYNDNYYDTLTQRHYPFSRAVQNCSLFNPVIDYAGSLRTKIIDIYSHNNSRLILMTPKIEWLLYGQRSDYQCEDTIYTEDALWFYSFQYRSGASIRDYQYNGGNYVLYVSSIESGPGAQYVLKRLKANTEQCRAPNVNGAGDWTDDSECDWLIKPRIRIDSAFANNPSNFNTLVCKIEVKNQNANIFKTVDLRVRNFLVDTLQTYDGRYIEEYRFIVGVDSLLTYHGKWGDNNAYWSARGNHNPDGTYDNHVDIQVYWYDNCAMWIDYVRVDNDVADELMNPNNPNYVRDNQWIQYEVEQIADHQLVRPAVMKYYTELTEFNNIPCMAYVNKKLKEYSDGRVDLMVDWHPRYSIHVPWDDRLTVMNSQHIKRFWVDSLALTAFFAEAYPFNSNEDPATSNSIGKIPSTLPVTSCVPSGIQPCGIMAYPIPPAEFDTWLQDNMDHEPFYFASNAAYDETLREYFWQRGLFRFIMELGDDISKSRHIPFIHMPQAHSWYFQNVEVHNEPTNEELDLQANLSVSYGVRGLLYFWWYSWHQPGEQYYSRSIAEETFELREKNIYQQEKTKKQTFLDLTARMRAWEPYIMSFDDDNRHSYIFQLEDERNQLLNPSNSYFYDVLTYKIGQGPFPCSEDYPEGYPMGWIGECSDDRYVQVATFKKTELDGNQYFMLVNRRCSPFYDESCPDSNGGQRWIKLRFSANHPAFQAFNSWKIVDVATGRDVDSFDKRYYSFLDMGKFMPGEGRLYKIIPVPRAGGTLVADEYIENQNFTCEDTVWNDGHNITIIGSSDVSFSDSATIIMEGGTFQSGDASGGPLSNKITYSSAVNGHKWGGLRFTDANVKIYNSEFLNISSSQGNNYAINTVDCPLNDVRYNVFTSSTDTTGAVNIAYVNYSPFGAPPNSYVMFNNFAMDNSYSRAVQVQGFAGLTEGVYIKGNTMTSNGYATGVFLSTVTGGVIKNNNFSGFETAINTMSSTCDLYGNTISNSTNESKGIYAVESSVLNLAPSGSQWTGGMNNITNTKDNSINLDIDESNFTLSDGANSFDIPTGSQPYHLYGSFVSESYNSNATGNCFKLSGTEINEPELPNNYLTNGYEQVTLDFISYNCSQSMPECSDIVSIGNGLYDTIPRTCGGGGGEIGILPLTKGELEGVYSKTTPAFGHPSLSRRGAFVLTPKQLQDSIKIQMRHRNYARVKILCSELVGNYPESIESISSLQTLYMAAVLSDTTTSSRSALKAFYEGLILNHGNNEALVEISNYLVQKCKVLLRQYTSALTGFQTIINNNQYNYRGLLARWDYMATSLLMNGGGGGESSETPNVKREKDKTEEAEITDEELVLLDGYDQLDDDKNPYNKEERVTIQKNVRTVNERSKSIGEKRIQVLEREAKQNNQRAKNELQRINTMKQVIKTEKPKNVIEHIKIVNNDIQTVFGSTLSNKSNSINNIPSVYRLAQNYPNPFNPVTTIKYELPKDSKVKLVVYDLLGREVRALVNEIKSAGYYQIEFNMQNYASGVYFYRIEADPSSSSGFQGKEFIDAKKMVLVK